MEIIFSFHAWQDFNYWLDNDPKVAHKIRVLLNSIVRMPFSGIGKPEPLKGELQGFWSRRITSEHRLVYRITGKKGVDQKCFIAQCRYHY